MYFKIYYDVIWLIIDDIVLLLLLEEYKNNRILKKIKYNNIIKFKFVLIFL